MKNFTEFFLINSFPFKFLLIGLLILIIACIFNIMNKFIRKTSLNNELESSATYVNQNQDEKDKNLDK